MDTRLCCLPFCQRRLRHATLSWTPIASNTVANDIVIRVVDGRGAASLVHYTVNVAGANNPPIITSIPDQYGQEGQTLSIPVQVADADGHPVTVSIRNLPAGAHYDALAGVIRWTPSYSQAGTYDNLTVVAQDGLALVTQRFSITIAQGYAAPVLNPIPAQTLIEGRAFGLQLAGRMPGGVTQTDGATITLSYSSSSLPPGALLDHGQYAAA